MPLADIRGARLFVTDEGADGSLTVLYRHDIHGTIFTAGDAEILETLIPHPRHDRNAQVAATEHAYRTPGWPGTLVST